MSRFFGILLVAVTIVACISLSTPENALAHSNTTQSVQSVAAKPPFSLGCLISRSNAIKSSYPQWYGQISFALMQLYSEFNGLPPQYQTPGQVIVIIARWLWGSPELIAYGIAVYQCWGH